MVFTTGAPGVRVIEEVSGAVAVEASFSRLYVLGTASTLGPNRKYGEPYQITSLEHFREQFGSSSAYILNSLEWLFDFYGQIQLFYCPVQRAERHTMQIDQAAQIGQYSITFTVNGSAVVITHNALVGQTLSDITQALATKLNNDVRVNTLVELDPSLDPQTGVPNYATGRLVLRAKLPNTALPTYTLTNNITKTAIPDSDPVAVDEWAYGINNNFEEWLEPGYLVIPEAFHTLSNQADRTSVQQAMELFCSQIEYSWLAIVDPGPPALINEFSAMDAERANYSSVRGHSAYIGPVLFDSDGDYISPSVCQAAVGLKRSVLQGFFQPPAGPEYPLGAVKVPYSIRRSQHAVLNNNGVNVIKRLRGAGVVIYGAVTMAGDPRLRFMNARVVLNIYERALSDSLEQANVVFRVIDGQDELFNQIKAVADALCFRMWEAGALFGATPSQAFRNICDRTNNPDFDIQSGRVTLQSYVIPSPTAEQVEAKVAPVAIGFLDDTTSDADTSVAA